MKIEIEGKTGDEGRQTYSAKEEKGRAGNAVTKKPTPGQGRT